jgi:hypothetical protein
MVMFATSRNGYALCHASEKLQNDKDLLLLLEKNKDMSKGVMSGGLRWYEARMRVLESYREQDVIGEAVKDIKVDKKVKVNKF